MKYQLILTNKFKKSLKAAKKRGLNLRLLEEIVNKLQNDIALEPRYRDHNQKGKFSGFRECHIQPVIYIRIYSQLTEKTIKKHFLTGENVFSSKRNS